MKRDPGQKRNVLRKYPGVARRMEKALLNFLEEVGTPGENYALIRPVQGPDYADKTRQTVPVQLSQGGWQLH